MFQSRGTSTDEIDLLNASATSLRHEDTRKALEQSLKAQSLASKIQYRQGYAEGLFLASLCRFILGPGENIIEEIQEALRLYRELDDPKGCARAHSLIADCYDRFNQHELALENYGKALEVWKSIGNHDGESSALNNMGIVYINRGEFAEALEYLFASLDAAEHCHESAERARSSAYALANIGRVFKDMNNLDDSMSYYRRALEANARSNDLSFNSTVHKEMGHISALRGDHEAALESLRKSLQIARKTGNLNDEGFATLTIGKVLTLFADVRRADSMLRTAFRIFRKTRDRGAEAESISALGENLLAQGKFGEAIPHLEKSLGISLDAKMNHQSARNHRLLSRAHELMANYGEALKHHQLYHEIWQRTHSQEVERRIRSLMTRNSLVKAEKELEEHKSRNKELASALEELRSANSEKEALLVRLKAQSLLLEQISREDGLTGLANRRWLDLQLNQEFERALRFSHPLSVAMMDLDDFKSVNDNFSHVIGDAVLRTFADILRATCRKVDIVGRYGGDEFMILLVETSRDQAEKVCHAIRESISRFDWQSIHPELGPLSVSIGIYGNESAASAQEIVALADRQLYDDKRSRSGRVGASKV